MHWRSDAVDRTVGTAQRRGCQDRPLIPTWCGHFLIEGSWGRHLTGCSAHESQTPTSSVGSGDHRAHVKRNNSRQRSGAVRAAISTEIRLWSLGLSSRCPIHLLCDLRQVTSSRNIWEVFCGHPLEGGCGIPPPAPSGIHLLLQISFHSYFLYDSDGTSFAIRGYLSLPSHTSRELGSNKSSLSLSFRLSLWNYNLQFDFLHHMLSPTGSPTKFSFRWQQSWARRCKYTWTRRVTRSESPEGDVRNHGFGESTPKKPQFSKINFKKNII